MFTKWFDSLSILLKKFIFKVVITNEGLGGLLPGKRFLSIATDLFNVIAQPIDLIAVCKQIIL